jgi:CheY-like chemotaxis protein
MIMRKLAAQTTAPLEAILTKRSKLLVVDDQPINIQVLYQTFSADYDVCMATNGEQALKVCAEQNPDLILLDIEMPGMNGYEVCLRLKADSATNTRVRCGCGRFYL